MRPLNDAPPGCGHYLVIVQDRHAYQHIPDEFPGNTSWSASQIFHADCESCSERCGSESDGQLCSSCRHLRLRHLSFCLSAKDLPTNIPIPEPEHQPNCPLCQIFGKFLRGEPSPRPFTIEQVLHHSAFPQRLYLSISKWRSTEVQWRITSTDLERENVGYLIVHGEVSSSKSIQPSGPSIGLPCVGPKVEDMNRIKECISKCCASHEWCDPTREVQLPQIFRLIDVRRECISISNSHQMPKYVALSYVWGDIQDEGMIQSTRATISQFSRKMNIGILPATIRDAIIVCRQLGEQYLWVDRLCILQDDEDDKAQQIQAMSAVFSAAKLVIVAACGQGMADGLAGISRPRLTQFSRQFSGMQVNVRLPSLWDVVGQSVWDTRGWTYQEAILSNRKLFFTDAQVFFECAIRIDHEEHLAYSSFDDLLHNKQGYPTSTSSLEYGFLRTPRRHFDESELRGMNRRESSWQAYVRHVNRYRHRSLRYQSDILNAFAGIMWALYPKGTVHYGVPSAEIDMALLWTPESSDLQGLGEGRGNTVSEQPSQLPSWAWASSTLEIPRLHVEHDFYCSLCVFFRPVPNDASKLELQPIIAASNEVGAFSRIYDRAHLPATMAILGGLIDFHNIQETATWNDMSFSELKEFLEKRWPTYADFWMETFGHEQILKDKQKEPTGSLGISLSTRMLITRTQVAKLNVRVAGDHLSRLIILSNTGEEIGYLHENNKRISDLQRQGHDTFDCLALSLSRCSAFSLMSENFGKPSVQNSFEDRERAILNPIPMVNILVVRREGGCCFRIGIGKVYLKSWIDLDAPFESVVLL